MFLSKYICTAVSLAQPSTAIAKESVNHTIEVPCTQLREPVQSYTTKAQINSSRAQHGASAMDQPSNPPTKTTSLTRFLETYAEPYTIRTERALLYKTGFISLAVRYGPLVIKQFSRDHEEIYEVSSGCQRGFSIAIELPWFLSRRIILTVFAWQELSRSRGLSLRWNRSFPSVVPNSAPVMQLALTGLYHWYRKLILSGRGFASRCPVRWYQSFTR